ncbi:hypothetical protein AOLI_G00078390 [Acnodon oligacanthus]
MEHPGAVGTMGLRGKRCGGIRISHHINCTLFLKSFPAAPRKRVRRPDCLHPPTIILPSPVLNITVRTSDRPISSLGVKISKLKHSLHSSAHVLPLQANSLLLINEINGQKKLHPTYGKRNPLIITEGPLIDELTDFVDTWISNGYSDVKRGALIRLK